MTPPPFPTGSRPNWKPSQSEPPSNNLWIGNLGPEVSEADLEEVFGKYGPIDCITYYPPRNFAFVCFRNIEDAKAAKDNLQGTIIHRYHMKIDFAKPAKPCNRLWVAGISQSVSQEELEEEFNMFGKIQEFKFLRDRNTAYVDYFTVEDASQALKSMNRKQIAGDVLRVEFLRCQPSRREQGPDYRDNREGQFPNRSILPRGSHWMPEDSFKSYSEPIFDGSRRNQYISATGRNGEGQPSKVLRIHYPSFVPVDKNLLHNAMILFGEIDDLKTYEDRNFALVQFRSVDEARLAKDGLQGKLFGDPRILIEYSNSEFSPPNEAFGSYADLNGSIPDKVQSDIPTRQGQMDLFTHEHHILAPRGRGVMRQDAILRPGYTNTELDDFAFANIPQQGKHHSPLERQNLRRQSPGPGMPSSPSGGLGPQHITSSSPCDMPYATTHLRRESKRQRVGGTLPPYDAPLPIKVVDECSGLDDPFVIFEGREHLSQLNNRSFSTGHGQRRADNDYMWRGVIERGGRHVCHARCVPIGEGIGSEIPDVVNCTERTGLDLLTKHYADAVGFRIVYFLPDSEADFAPYTEFLRYLESKSRAGVAKFGDGTPLFLVPPSDFLTSTLKVSGPERLYGVVLEFPQTAPSVALNQPQYSVLQSQNTCQTGYNELPKGESTLQRNYNTFNYDGVKAPPKTPGPPIPVPPVNSAAVTQPAVPLTHELIATLASLLPASNKLSGAKNSLAEAVSSALAPAINITPNQDRDQVVSETWIDKHQLPEGGAHPAHQLCTFPSQAQFTPQDHHLAYESVSSSTPSLSSQMPVGYYQGKDHVYSLQPQAFVSSRAGISSIPLHQGQHTVPLHFDQHSDGMTQGTDPMSWFGSSGLQNLSNAAGTLVSGTGTSNSTPHLLGVHMPLASEADIKNQMSQNHNLNFAKHGVGPEVAETEDEKNRRYQTTLMFAANLLSKVQQPPEKPSGQSSGSH